MHKKILSTTLSILLATGVTVPQTALAVTYTPWWTAVEEVSEPNWLPVIPVFTAAGATMEEQTDGGLHIAFLGAEVVMTPDSDLFSINSVDITLTHPLTVIDNQLFMSELDIMAFDQHFFAVVSRVFELTPEARDIALHDFDYLVDLVLNNSAWDSVVYAIHGISFEQHAAVHREMIERMTPVQFLVIDELFTVAEGDDPVDLAANYLSHFLFHSFSAGLGHIGHMAPRDLGTYRFQVTAVARGIHQADTEEEAQLIERMWAPFFTPEAVHFYGEVAVDLDEEEHPMPVIAGNVTTHSLETGRVAYLHIGSFMSNPEEDDTYILPFLQQVAVDNYEHLIIDIRGNMGGLVNYFNPLIASRLLAEPTVAVAAEFFSAGEQAQYTLGLWHDAVALAVAAGEAAVAMRIVPIEEAIEILGLTYFDPVILAHLDYAWLSQSVMELAEDHVGFDGQVWLLVDEMSWSASVLAAMTAMETGFATVVGSNTSGILGVTHMYRALPHTGIIWRTDIGFMTDAQGRSLEVYGLTPDVLNMEGMDALETVLQLIG